MLCQIGYDEQQIVEFFGQMCLIVVVVCFDQFVVFFVQFGQYVIWVGLVEVDVGGVVLQFQCVGQVGQVKCYVVQYVVFGFVCVFLCFDGFLICDLLIGGFVVGFVVKDMWMVCYYFVGDCGYDILKFEQFGFGGYLVVKYYL